MSLQQVWVLEFSVFYLFYCRVCVFIWFGVLLDWGLTGDDFGLQPPHFFIQDGVGVAIWRSEAQ